tara:strand:- start:348 stop:584 length:237 start_codon:yes stop_codon:yes gene_type:complete
MKNNKSGEDMMAIWHMKLMQEEEYDELIDGLENIHSDKRIGLFVARLVDKNEDFAKLIEDMIGYELQDRDYRKHSKLN